ncbi:hypothetical protein B0H12DRAFT_1057239 [Mycena haematopus]|nr:hypothetical protein B0H12DRAFT_1057239 [Mycena haematopus]
MFSALRLCASVFLVVSLTAAVDIPPPTGVTSGGSAVITWTDYDTLPTFSIELANPKFHDSLAIANNVDPTKGTITVSIPSVPEGAGYTLQFVNITDINQLYGESDEFSIDPTVTESLTTTGGTATGTVLSTSASPTATIPVSSSTASLSTHVSGASSMPAVSGSASASRPSSSASGAATRVLLQGASTTVASAGIVVLSLLFAAWIL